MIVQKYIETRTKAGNPADFRSHMMKDGNLEWRFATIYPRIGFNYASISTVYDGGYRGELNGFLKQNFGATLSCRIS